MIKELQRFIVLLLSVMFFALGCRSDEAIAHKQEVMHEKIAAFERFEENLRSGRSNRSSYAYPFRETIEYYFYRHPNFAKEFKNKLGYLDLGVSSQAITMDNDEKVIFFPILDSAGKVVSVLGCKVNENRSFVEFRIIQSSEFKKAISEEFQIVYNMLSLYRTSTKNEGSDVERNIEEVVVVGYRHLSANQLSYFIGFGADFSFNFAGTMDGGSSIYGGSGGSGNDSHSHSYSQNDPCAKASAGVVKANTLLADTRITTKFTEKLKAEAKTNMTSEVGITISKDANGNIHVSEPLVRNSNTSGYVPDAPAGYTAIADGHNHYGSFPPSAGDIWTMLEKVAKDGSFETRYTFGADGSIYALTVNDRQDAINFLQKYPKNQYIRKDANGNYTGSFNEETSIYSEFMIAKNSFMYSTPFLNDRESYAAAQSFIMNKFSAGISLSKYNGTKFQTIKSIQNTDSSYSTTQCQ